MISDIEAQQLMEKFVSLNKEVKQNPKLKNDFLKVQKECIDKFNYIISMRTARYKAFSNYEDLNQIGLEALLMAMSTFNPKKGGSFFYWAHKYIDTRISRNANLHTTIRYPLKVAKELPPHREAVMPLLIEDIKRPDKQLELKEKLQKIENIINDLDDIEKDIVNFSYGLDGDKPLSVSKVAEKMNISRSFINKTLKKIAAKAKSTY